MSLFGSLISLLTAFLLFAVPSLSFSPILQPPKNVNIASIATATIIANPLIALAVEEADDYEYGAVDAPIGIAIGGGILAILTALLPVALRGSEEAFEEMRDRDEDSFGKRNNLLNRRK